MGEGDKPKGFPSEQELKRKILYLELLHGGLLERLEGGEPFTSTELHEYQAALRDLSARLSQYSGEQDAATVKMMVDHCLNLIEKRSQDTPTDPNITAPQAGEKKPNQTDQEKISEESIHQLMLGIQSRLLHNGKTPEYIAGAVKKIEKEIRTIIRHIVGTNSPEALLDYLAKILGSSQESGHGFLATGHLHDLSNSERESVIKIIRDVGERRLISLSETMEFDINKFLTARLRLHAK